MTKKRKPVVDLMLDSGAFSAWNQNTTLDLGPYIEYIKEAGDLLWSYVNMDVLPPRRAVTVGKETKMTSEAGRTDTEIEDGAKASYANLQKMKKAGLSPIPVFHQGERLYWLERMLKDGDRYIGLSARKDLPASTVRRWLDQMFSILTDEAGRPLIKTHGFGITKPAFLLRYPWFTTDSTTWSLSAGYGKIFVPVYEDGKPNFLRPPSNVIMSGVLQGNPGAERRQFQGFGDFSQGAVQKFLEEECDLSVVETRYGTTNRRKAILAYYQGLCKALVNRRFDPKNRKASPFGHERISLGHLKPAGNWHLTLMYATSLSREWAALMNEVGASTRLLSYFEMKEKSFEVLEEYVTTGIYGTYDKKHPRRRWKSEGYRNFRRLGLSKRLKDNTDDPGRAGKEPGDSQSGSGG